MDKDDDWRLVIDLFMKFRKIQGLVQVVEAEMGVPAGLFYIDRVPHPKQNPKQDT